MTLRSGPQQPPTDAARVAGPPISCPQRHDSTLRLLRLIWPFLVTVTLLLAIAAASFHLMSAGRAYVHGESLWSKGQKNAIQALARYSESCDRRHFERYTEAMSVPMGDRIARLELLRAEPDLRKAAAGFLQGGNHPDDIPGMITLFRRFGSLPLMRQAIDIWGEAELLLLELDAVAQALDRQLQAQCTDSASRHAVMDTVYALNDRMTPLERAFSDTLGQANRMIQDVLLGVMATASVLLTLVGTTLAWRKVRSSTATERQLEISERRYQLAAAGSQQGLWDLDIATGELFVSTGLRQLLGHEPGEGSLSRADFHRVLHPDERDAVQARLSAHAAGGIPFEDEFRLRHRDGGYRWYRTAGQSILDAEGRPVRFIGSAHDVTERRRLQDALLVELELRRNALDTLRAILAATPAADTGPHTPTVADDIDAVTHEVSALAARQRAANQDLAAILGLSPDGFVSFDSAQRVHHVSPAFTRITGLSADEVLGLDAHAFIVRLNRLCRPQAGLPEFEQLRRLAADGPVTLELAGAGHRVLTAELREGDQGAVRSVLCLRDVTREHEIERLKSEFMSTAAHELRTPMTSIFGFVELMRRRAMPAERRDELLAIIHSQAKLMIGIIDDLLDLTRLQTRTAADLALEPIDLVALVREAVDGYARPAGRDAPLLCDLPASLPVIGDHAKLARVFNNLLSNAYKYSPGGGEVRVSHLPGGDAATAGQIGICVEDHGIGMTAEQLARVGERFFRADMSGNIPGTGLGVSIVREILHLHGGSLRIDSEAGRGTRVSFFLPEPAQRSLANP